MEELLEGSPLFGTIQGTSTALGVRITSELNNPKKIKLQAVGGKKTEEDYVVVGNLLLPKIKFGSELSYFYLKRDTFRKILNKAYLPKQERVEKINWKNVELWMSKG